MNKRPLVGLGVIVIKDGKVLMSKRKGAHGAGSWSFAGGHLEFKEEFETCARREVMEEAGIEITNIVQATFTNSIFHDEDKHYVTLYVTAEHLSGEPEIKEPDRCEAWDWFDWDNLPQPLFLPIDIIVKGGYSPFSK